MIALDIEAIDPIPNVEVIAADILDPGTIDIIAKRLNRPATAILSDMAAPSTGHRQTDHLRVIALCEAALAVAVGLLSPGGAFVAKVLRGGTEQSLLLQLKRRFNAVRHFKPPTSRSDSAEIYVVATGFRGNSS